MCFGLYCVCFWRHFIILQATKHVRLLFYLCKHIASELQMLVAHFRWLLNNNHFFPNIDKSWNCFVFFFFLILFVWNRSIYHTSYSHLKVIEWMTSWLVSCLRLSVTDAIQKTAKNCHLIVILWFIDFNLSRVESGCCDGGVGGGRWCVLVLLMIVTVNVTVLNRLLVVIVDQSYEL